MAFPGQTMNVTEVVDEEIEYMDYDYGAGADYPPNMMMEYMYYPEERASWVLSVVFPPITLLVGTIGNILSCIVLVKLADRVLPICGYLVVLTVTDLIMLYSRTANDWVKQVWESNVLDRLSTYSNAMCQLYNFFTSVFLQTGSWLVVIASYEALLVASKPKKSHKMFSFERAKNSVLVLSLMLICINAHFFWTYRLLDVLDEKAAIATRLCTFTQEGTEYNMFFRKFVWPIIDNLVTFLFPHTLILVCCSKTLYIAIRKRENLVILEENHFLLCPEEARYLVRVVLFVGYSTVLLSLPEACYTIYESVLEQIEETGHTDSIESFYTKKLIQDICYVVKDVLLSSKIFLYIIVWKLFRTELIMLRKMCTKSKKKGSIIYKQNNLEHGIHETQHLTDSNAMS